MNDEYYRVAEMNNNYPNGWIFCSNNIYSYNEAREYALEYQRRTGRLTQIAACRNDDHYQNFINHDAFEIQVTDQVTDQMVVSKPKNKLIEILKKYSKK